MILPEYEVLRARVFLWERDLLTLERDWAGYRARLDALAGRCRVAARSGGLRPEPCSTVSALRAPAAIAREARQ